MKGAGEDTEANTNKILPVFPHMRISDLRVYLRDIPVWFRDEKKIQKGGKSRKERGYGRGKMTHMTHMCENVTI